MSSSLQDSWLKNDAYKSWIIKTTDKSKARCRVGAKDISVSGMGESALRSHAKAVGHQQKLARIQNNESLVTMLSSENPRQLTPETVAEARNSESGAGTSSSGSGQVQPNIVLEDSAISTRYLVKQDTIKAEVLWTLYTIERHHSFHSNDGIDRIFQAMFPDSVIAQNFTCAETKTMYIARFGLAEQFGKLLRDAVSGKKFVCLFDESFNLKTKLKELDVMVRFWCESKDGGSVVTRYLGSRYMGHASADILLENILEVLDGLDMKDLLQVSMDGPNVNWKMYATWSTKLNETGFLELGSCGLNIVHNSFKVCFKNTRWELEVYFTNCYYLFKDSACRREDTEFTGSKNFPPKFSQTRWLENVSVANFALENLEIMMKYVKEVKKRKLPAVNKKSFQTVRP